MSWSPHDGERVPRSTTQRCRGCDCEGRGYGIRCGRQDCRRCEEFAVLGDTMCPRHGGSTWNDRVRERWDALWRIAGRGPIGVRLHLGKEKRAAVGRAMEVAKLGTPRKIDPGEALLEEVARAAGHVDYLLEKCRELEESELVWSKVQAIREEQQGDGESAGSYQRASETHQQEIHKWWEMYRDERRHLTEVSATTLRAGVDERRVRIAERTSSALSSVVEGVVRDLGFDPAEGKVAAIIGNRFRELLAVDPNMSNAVSRRDEDAGPGTVIDGGPIRPVDF